MLSHFSSSFILWVRELNAERQSNLTQVRSRTSEISRLVLCFLHLPTSGRPHHFPSPLLSTRNSKPSCTKNVFLTANYHLKRFSKWVLGGVKSIGCNMSSHQTSVVCQLWIKETTCHAFPSLLKFFMHCFWL